MVSVFLIKTCKGIIAYISLSVDTVDELQAAQSSPSVSLCLVLGQKMERSEMEELCTAHIYMVLGFRKASAHNAFL